MLSITTLAALAALSGSGQAYAPQQDQAQRVAPRGSYAQSCSNSYVNRGRLYADCRTRNGQVRGTSIELERCSRYEIANIDGLLTCGPIRGEFENSGGNRPGGDRPGGDRPGGDRPGGGWSGGQRASITVFADANYRGATTTFNGEVANLTSSGFNDIISSVRLRGEWEVCSDAYFQGVCRTINADVSNLSRIGMNDRISSLRPARRNSDRW